VASLRGSFEHGMRTGSCAVLAVFLTHHGIELLVIKENLSSSLPGVRKFIKFDVKQRKRKVFVMGTCVLSYCLHNSFFLAVIH